ncbi:cellulosome protein dockerin type I, partial [Paenibacillus sepulcri]|nr:cellulosome protein dockerin type I [Paenibacillus sepulcri]
MITRNAVKFLSLCLCLSLVVSGWVLPEAKAAVPVSKVTWNTELQKVDGFGGSGAFHKAGSIMRLQEPLRTQILDMIFSRESGIGISIVRNMMGDGGTWGSKEYDGPTETIEPEKGVFVWDDPQWATKKADFDKYQIWFMNEAKKRGVTTFMTSSWSPPAWMKTNNSVLGTGNGKLKKENYQDYADYLAEYVLGYKKHFDLDISYISLANEPNIGPAYSGTVWTADEMNVFIRDYLGPTFAARKVPAKIVMPEHVNFTEAYALPALNDPVTVNYVDVVATHAYGIGTNVPEFPVSREKGKPIWQTEYMNQGTGLQTFENNTITDALRYANLIGNMFDNTGISAYFWWWPAANNGADGSDLIRLSNDGSNQALAPTENGQYRVFKRYYSFGNYSRFIRPGYVMIGADKNPVDEVMVTAYKDPQTGNFSIVAVNNDSGPQTITFDLQDFPGGVDAVVPYRTSPNENLKKLGDIAVSGQSFTMELKGSSVTTFIPKKYELPALPEQKDVFSTYEAEENDGQSPGVKAT